VIRNRNTVTALLITEYTDASKNKPLLIGIAASAINYQAATAITKKEAHLAEADGKSIDDDRIIEWENISVGSEKKEAIDQMEPLLFIRLRAEIDSFPFLSKHYVISDEITKENAS